MSILNGLTGATDHLNSLYVSGKIKMPESSKDIINMVCEEVVNYDKSLFETVSRDSARQSDSLELIQIPTETKIKVLTRNKSTGCDDILVGPRAVLSCVLDNVPTTREDIEKFLSLQSKGDLKDNFPYYTLVDLKKLGGEPFVGFKLSQLNLRTNVANCKFQTDYTLREKELTPEEFLNMYIEVMERDIEKQIRLLNSLKGLVAS